MAAPEIIKELVTRFEDNKNDYRAANYKEFRLRKEFIDPLFEALGWDVGNKAGYAEAYKDVVHEDSIAISGAKKAPDYAFRIGGVRKFFVETKAPSINIKLDVSPAYQLRRYGWSSKLPLSILTDFEEFAVYDCRIKPHVGDKASTARVLFLSYDQLVDRWHEIDRIFSHKAILKGSFDKFADDSKSKKGTAEVDDAFLADIEKWRAALARNIAQKNELDVRDLNDAVQLTIDRIIFLRIAEDRGFETYGNLQKASKGAGVYGRLGQLFRNADARYNSGLFHFRKYDGSAATLDQFTLGLKIDDKPLRSILNSLYYPESPYEFSVLPADILGQVYEQFLGKIITLSGKSAKVEEKPEVKKSGGVYYTPTYIVRYIVNTTLGEILKDKTVADVSGRSAKSKSVPVRILDPACGSGSFLIEVYQYLLDWHRDRYVADAPHRHAKGKNPCLYLANKGEWRLTISEKRRILLTHIYGVDIDKQAVEVTKLSLLMKVLEGEKGDVVASQMNLFHMRALPDLETNIKCGNSLIDPSFYAAQAVDLFSDDQFQTINAFDWKEEFPFCVKGGSFDLVLGNPPYLNIDSVWGKRDSRLSAIKLQYPAVYNDKTDIYYYFIAKSLSLSKNFVSFICSRAFLESFKGDRLRQYIIDTSTVQAVLDFQNYAVFKGIGITTAIVTLQKRKALPKDTIQVYRCKLGKDLITTDFTPETGDFEHIKYPHKRLSSAPWNFAPPERQQFFDKLDNAGQPLGKVLEIGQGMQTGENGVFGRLKKSDIKAMKLPGRLYRKRATNSDIERYRIADRGEYLLYLEDENTFSGLPHTLQIYLTKNKKALSSRAACVRGDCEWWKYTWPLHKEKYKNARILCPYLADESRFALAVDATFLSLTDTTVIFDSGQAENLRYFLTLLNSRIIQVRYLAMAKLKSAGIYEYFWNSISRIPVKRINFKDASERAAHDRLVVLSREIEKLAKKIAESSIPTGKLLKQKQYALEAEVEKIVARLYGVTPEEVASNQVQSRAFGH